MKAITDHKALKWLLIMKKPKSRLVKWAMELSEYNIKIIAQEQMKITLLK